MTATHTTIRPLAPTEAVYVGLGLFVGYSVQVRGSLGVAALSQAFAALRRAYPILGSRLVIDEQGVAIVASPAPPAIRVFDDEVASVRYGTELDATRTVCELHVVREGERANVTLLIHHSVADGHHSLAVLAEFWSLYTDFVGGMARPAVKRHDYPRSLEALYAERGIDAVDARTPPFAPTEAPELDGGHQLVELTDVRCQLDETQTAALVAYGHRQGATINSLVSAAILLAIAEVHEVPLPELPYAFLVELRSRLSPPVAFTAGTNILGYGRYITEGDSAELADIARAIGARLATDLAAQTIHHTAVQAAGTKVAVLQELQQAPAAALATNWGRIPALRHPAALELEDFWPLFHMDVPTPIDLPENPTPFFVITGFDGRLSVDLLAPEPDDNDRAIVAALRARLEAAVQSAGPTR
ncbi:phthiocerol/phthiodiolone dimycocerosyl transferase family protein [Nocardia colli]|uniref:phthiocerol/phthiodiolone dimycocerosyl transferase family protein n=1 Tax=Nocardia colli TaxID=2545717 RepID=UPI0035DDAA2C